MVVQPLTVNSIEMLYQDAEAISASFDQALLEAVQDANALLNLGALEPISPKSLKIPPHLKSRHSVEKKHARKTAEQNLDPNAEPITDNPIFSLITDVKRAKSLQSDPKKLAALCAVFAIRYLHDIPFKNGARISDTEDRLSFPTYNGFRDFQVRIACPVPDTDRWHTGQFYATGENFERLCAELGSHKLYEEIRELKQKIEASEEMPFDTIKTLGRKNTRLRQIHNEATKQSCILESLEYMREYLIKAEQHFKIEEPFYADSSPTTQEHQHNL